MPDIASIASLLADSSRSRMLSALMDGRALTATELAMEADVLPSTASSHLSRLTEHGLLSIARQGRHRYFRIATPEVATAIETLMNLAAGRGSRAARPARPSHVADSLRRARVCYDHLAGETAVTLLGHMRSRRFVRDASETLSLTPAGEKWLTAFGVDLDSLRSSRRPLCRPCLDWTERRTHLAGAVGAALLDRLFALRMARRETGSRAVVFSAKGEAFLRETGR